MDSENTPSIPEALMSFTESLTPMVDACMGFRSQLVREGWTEEQAQATAALVLNGLVSTAFGMTPMLPTTDDNE